MPRKTTSFSSANAVESHHFAWLPFLHFCTTGIWSQGHKLGCGQPKQMETRTCGRMRLWNAFQKIFVWNKKNKKKHEQKRPITNWIKGAYSLAEVQSVQLFIALKLFYVLDKEVAEIQLSEKVKFVTLQAEEYRVHSSQPAKQMFPCAFLHVWSIFHFFGHAKIGVRAKISPPQFLSGQKQKKRFKRVEKPMEVLAMQARLSGQVSSSCFWLLTSSFLDWIGSSLLTSLFTSWKLKFIQ